jgi:integrase/recombinase XerD
LTKEEFDKLLKTCKNDRESCILWLLAGAGLRTGELVKIRIRDIDFAKGYLHIPRGKGNKRRTVFLVPEVIAALEKYDSSSEWLFPSRAGVRTPAPMSSIRDSRYYYF